MIKNSIKYTGKYYERIVDYYEEFPCFKFRT